MLFPNRYLWSHAIALLVGTAPVLGQGPTPAIGPLVDSIVGAELRLGPTAGFAIAIRYRGELLVAKGYGSEDLEHGIPVSVETVFRVGSITKQFTAAALLQLVDQGKVKLDEDVRTYVPEAPTGGRRVTVEQLLNHTSGIKNYTSLGSAFGRDTFRLDLAPTRILGYLESQPFDFEPGAGWLYNNTGYLIAGLIIERVSGLPYAEYLRRHLFEPLGLRSTSYCDDRAVVPHRAKGYDRVPGGFANAEPISMAIPFAAGAICSTVIDLIAWRQELGSGRLFSRALYDRMIQPAVLTNGWRTNYGYGLARYRIGSAEVIRHGGSINGFQANLMYLPEQDLIIAALANTSGSDPVGVADKIAARIIGAVLSEAATIDPISATELAEYVGRYRLGPLTIEVAARDGQLIAAPPGFPIPARLRRQTGDRFLASPLYALGFYGSATGFRFLRMNGKVTGFQIDHPMGPAISAMREAAP